MFSKSFEIQKHSNSVKNALSSNKSNEISLKSRSDTKFVAIESTWTLTIFTQYRREKSVIFFCLWTRQLNFDEYIFSNKNQTFRALYEFSWS